jgi:uncharacterized protein
MSILEKPECPRCQTSIEPKRVIVAINQADMAMKGRYWNARLNQPESTLVDFLSEQAYSVKQRIHASTGV